MRIYKSTIHFMGKRPSAEIEPVDDISTVYRFSVLKHLKEKYAPILNTRGDVRIQVDKGDYNSLLFEWLEDGLYQPKTVEQFSLLKEFLEGRHVQQQGTLQKHLLGTLVKNIREVLKVLAKHNDYSIAFQSEDPLKYTKTNFDTALKTYQQAQQQLSKYIKADAGI